MVGEKFDNYKKVLEKSGKKRKIWIHYRNWTKLSVANEKNIHLTTTRTNYNM